MTIFHIQQLSFERDERKIFSNLEFSLQSGEVLQIIGPNGCGKTTLLRVLCGLMPPSNGEIYWQGQSIARNTDYSANLHYLGHKAGIKSGLTVRENLQMALALTSSRSEFSIDSAINAVGLMGNENAFAFALSAGQQRRVLFAKLLLLNVRLWLLDEPFAALDKAGINLVESLMQQHLERQGMIVLTSHQPFASLMVQSRLKPIYL